MREMRIVAHRDGSYSIVGLGRGDIQDLERAVYKDYGDWEKSASATYLPSHYAGSSWTLESYLTVNRQIADRMLEIQKMLNAIAYPVRTDTEMKGCS